MAEKKTIREYIDVKLISEDYHAVSDACNDIRELETEMKAYEKIILLCEKSY